MKGLVYMRHCVYIIPVSQQSFKVGGITPTQGQEDAQKN